MVDLFEKASGSLIGQITEEEFEFLRGLMEEESETDDDYFVDRGTIGYLQQNGVSPGLQQLLEKALGEAESIEIVYKKEDKGE